MACLLNSCGKEVPLLGSSKVSASVTLSSGLLGSRQQISRGVALAQPICGLQASESKTCTTRTSRPAP